MRGKRGQGDWEAWDGEAGGRGVCPAVQLARGSAGCGMVFKPGVGEYTPAKIVKSHIDASLSRQPLVKGERLVRYEVNAVINQNVVHT